MNNKKYYYMNMINNLGDDFKYRIHFDGDAKRQSRNADSEAGVLARVSKDGHDKIRSAVHDFGLVKEIRCRGNEAAELDAAFDFSEVSAQRSVRLRENADGA